MTRFESNIKTLRRTTDNNIAGVFRLVLGFLFVMTGLMKLLIPNLGEAFSGQLLAADIPYHSFNIWFVPIAETVTGILLLFGFFTRIGCFMVINMMLVATYVHLVVNDPSLFPLQPEKPFIPLVAIVLATYVLVCGGGSWSLDLSFTKSLKKPNE